MKRLMHSNSMGNSSPAPATTAGDAAEICAAVEALDDKLVDMTLHELPQNDDEYDENGESENDAKQKRGFFGKIGKGLYRRTLGMGRSVSDNSSENDLKEKLAMVMGCRSPVASPIGGIAIQDPEEARACRSVLSLMVRQMGKNLLKGGNVMNVSFPIQCCQPRTVMEIAATQGGFSHIYLPRAAAAADPVERMKNVVACFVSAMTLTSGNFLKPLNPILGETFQVEYGDGSRLWMEQTCHHPPVSSFHFEGPNQIYKCYGYTGFTVGFGYNKMFLTNTGLRVVEFPDGGKITFDFPLDRWGNVYWGNMHHESFGTQTYTDEKNGIRCRITFNPEGMKNLPSDYFEGTIEKYSPHDPEAEGTPLSTVEGSWVGFCDFDKVRFWDVRTTEKMPIICPKTILPSDSRNRGDRNALAAKDFKMAQSEKIRLEEQQRHEQKLRVEAGHGKH